MPRDTRRGLFSRSARRAERQADHNRTTVSVAADAGKAPDYPSLVLRDSPGAYWRLGETIGTLAEDSSGNRNSGSYVGGVTLGAPGLIADVNPSASFDGVDARMHFPDSSSLSLTSAISLEAWVRPDVVPTSSGSGWHLVSKWDTALLFLTGGASPKFAFSVYDIATSSYGPAVISMTTVAAAATYHVVGTYDGSDLRIYVYGALEGAVAQSGSVNSSSLGGALSGGGWGTVPSPAFSGRLDEIAIYGSALSSARVQVHCAKGTSP
jgi:hypothetical protein